MTTEMEQIYEIFILPAMAVKGIEDTLFNRFKFIQEIRFLEEQNGDYVVREPGAREVLAVEAFQLQRIMTNL